MTKAKRIAFDFEKEQVASFEKLVQIICSSHWSSSLNIAENEKHVQFLGYIMTNVIVIDEHEYELPKLPSQGESPLKYLLGKKSDNPVLWDIHHLFAADQPEACEYFSNTLHIPRIKAFVRADGIKPEDIAEMLILDDCDRIFLFPYCPLDKKKAFYELSLGIEKNQFYEIIKDEKAKRLEEMRTILDVVNRRVLGECSA